jgi:hypothetical protein
MWYTAFKLCFQIQFAPLHHGAGPGGGAAALGGLHGACKRGSVETIAARGQRSELVREAGAEAAARCAQHGRRGVSGAADGWACQTLLATSQDAVEVKRQGFKISIDDVSSNIVFWV